MGHSEEETLWINYGQKTDKYLKKAGLFKRFLYPKKGSLEYKEMMEADRQIREYAAKNNTKYNLRK